MPMRFARRLRCSAFPLGLVLIACAAQWAGPLGCSESPPPTALLGRWTTEDPRYEGRALEITPELVTLELGPAGTQVMVIDEISARAEPDGTVRYAVRYHDQSGEEQTLRLELERGATPVLRFENHTERWRRQPATAHGTRGQG